SKAMCLARIGSERLAQRLRDGYRPRRPELPARSCYGGDRRTSTAGLSFSRRDTPLDAASPLPSTGQLACLAPTKRRGGRADTLQSPRGERSIGYACCLILILTLPCFEPFSDRSSLSTWPAGLNGAGKLNHAVRRDLDGREVALQQPR